jgi:hypothetical protein
VTSPPGEQPHPAALGEVQPAAQGIARGRRLPGAAQRGAERNERPCVLEPCGVAVEQCDGLLEKCDRIARPGRERECPQACRPRLGQAGAVGELDVRLGERAARLALPMTSVLLATLLLFFDGLAVMPLFIVAVVVPT